MIIYALLTALALLGLAGFAWWRWSHRDRIPLPRGSLDRKRFNHQWQPLQLAPAELRPIPQLEQQPPTALPADIRHALAAVGLPLRDARNTDPPALPGAGYQTMLLEVPADRLARILELNGYHDPSQDPDTDIRALLQRLLEMDLISGWYGIPAVGVHVQLSYEQMTWWYAWLDWDRKRMTTGLGRPDLHSWA